jgi:hypothetical protein
VNEKIYLAPASLTALQPFYDFVVNAMDPGGEVLVRELVRFAISSNGTAMLA